MPTKVALLALIVLAIVLATGMFLNEAKVQNYATYGVFIAALLMILGGVSDMIESKRQRGCST